MNDFDHRNFLKSYMPGQVLGMTSAVRGMMLSKVINLSYRKNIQESWRFSVIMMKEKIGKKSIRA